jgi:cytochrome c1
MKRSAALPLVLALAGCRGGHVARASLGDAGRGRADVARLGCGSCHEIPGVTNARGRVGPILVRFAEQQVIAGRVPNTTDNLVRWLRDPQAISPGTLMPTLGLSDSTARDIAAFLYTVR